ncbi:HtrA protease/chaperone protein [hydrothermal vent metagenome]|uniref:Probable periplasmic serine endoprotease DegP-like n=1 Tax=hydrothermal vent metagenome TaxID=652676 RepID=A0A3B0THA6_9ZZZZ
MQRMVLRRVILIGVLVWMTLAAPLAPLAPLAALAQQGPASVAALAARLSGAVVNISTSRMVAGGAGVPFPDAPDGSPLKDLLQEINPNFGDGERLMREASSLGSGFFISADGLIVTNNHVVAEADEILIYSAAGERYSAKIIGADEKTDLAVLKITVQKPVEFVEFGNSDMAQVGDWVMAIGNPFGLGGSVSLGIVSARNRNINSGPYDDFIQTDAAINQGNSGGPLFDMNGKVIGVATAIISRGGSSRGIGFALPGNLVKSVTDQLVAYGQTRRGWLGVGIQALSEDIALSLGLTKTSGALVVEVTKGGPSDGALRERDLIVGFNGAKIENMRDLPKIVARTPVGQSVMVKIIRDGKTIELAIRLGRLEDGERLIAAARNQQLNKQDLQDKSPGQEIVGDGVRLSSEIRDMIGLDVMPLSAQLRSRLGFGARARGLLITGVANPSDAASKGVAAGLVIKEVNQKPVLSVGDLEKIVNMAFEAGRPIILLKLVDPSGGTRLVAVRLG